MLSEQQPKEPTDDLVVVADLLHDWVLSGNDRAFSLFEEALDKLADKNIKGKVFRGSDEEGSLLYWACGTNLWDIGHAKRKERLSFAVDFLLQKGLIWKGSSEEALRMGWPHIIELIRRHGDPLSIDESGGNALHRTVSYAIADETTLSKQFLSKLIEMGVSPHEKGVGVFSGMNPLEYALSLRAYDNARILVSVFESEDAGLYLDVIKIGELIANGERHFERWPINRLAEVATVAAGLGMTREVEVLANAGAPISVEAVLDMAGKPDGNVNDALEAAILNSWLGAVPFILKSGGDPNLSVDGKPLAFLFVKLGGRHSVFIDAGVDPNLSENGLSFFESAFSYESSDLVARLVPRLSDDTIRAFIKRSESKYQYGYQDAVFLSFMEQRPSLMFENDALGIRKVLHLIAKNTQPFVVDDWTLFVPSVDVEPQCLSLIANDLYSAGNLTTHEQPDFGNNKNRLSFFSAMTELIRRGAEPPEGLIRQAIKNYPIDNSVLSLIKEIVVKSKPTGEDVAYLINEIFSYAERIYAYDHDAPELEVLVSAQRQLHECPFFNELFLEASFKHDFPSTAEHASSLLRIGQISPETFMSVADKAFSEVGQGVNFNASYVASNLLSKKEYGFTRLSPALAKHLFACDKGALCSERFLSANIEDSSLDEIIPVKGVSADTLASIIDKNARRLDELFKKLNFSENDASLRKVFSEKRLSGAMSVLDFFDALHRGDFNQMLSNATSDFNLAPAFQKYSMDYDALRSALEVGSAPLFKALGAAGLNAHGFFSIHGGDLVKKLVERNDKRILSMLVEEKLFPVISSKKDSAYLYIQASKSGDLETFSILRRLGVPLDIDVIASAVDAVQNIDDLGPVVISCLSSDLKTEFGHLGKESITTYRSIFNRLSPKNRRDFVAELCENADIDFLEHVAEDKNFLSYKDFDSIDVFALPFERIEVLFPFFLESRLSDAQHSLAEISEILHAASGRGIPERVVLSAMKESPTSTLSLLFAHGTDASFSTLYGEADRLGRKDVLEMLLSSSDKKKMVSEIQSNIDLSEISPYALALLTVAGGSALSGKYGSYGLFSEGEKTPVSFIREFPELLPYAHPDLLKDKAFVRVAVSVNPTVLSLAPIAMRADFDVAYDACRNAKAEELPEIFKMLHPALIKELELTRENCVEKLREATNTSMFQVFKKLAFSKAREAIAKTLFEPKTSNDRISINMTFIESSLSKVQLSKKEMLVLRLAVGAARRLNDQIGVDVLDADRPEMKKIIERNLPELIEKYAALPKNERELPAANALSTPAQDFAAALSAAYEKLSSMEKRAADFVKTGISAEAATITWQHQEERSFNQIVDDENDRRLKFKN